MDHAMDVEEMEDMVLQIRYFLDQEQEVVDMWSCTLNAPLKAHQIPFLMQWEQEDQEEQVEEVLVLVAVVYLVHLISSNQREALLGNFQRIFFEE